MNTSPLCLRDRSYVLIWLYCLLALLTAMVLLGGYTRLSGSGLSITQWKPIAGIIPPHNEMQWVMEWNRYKETTQYEQLNPGMTLEEFRAIFWPEFLHRLLGRIIGLALLIPGAVFFFRHSISRPLCIRLLGIFALGGMQGFIGWWMVQSGLDATRVSHLRLSAHLSLAFTIIALLVWALLDVRHENEPRPARNTALSRFTVIAFAALCLQIVLGAWMAGLHAGLAYPEFPLMNGALVPNDLWHESPWWVNLYQNVTTVHFLHRWYAFAVAMLLSIWWACVRTEKPLPHLRARSNVVLCLLGVQMGLGIATLLSQVALPLALLHQWTGLLLFVTMAASLHATARTSR